MTHVPPMTDPVPDDSPSDFFEESTPPSRGGRKVFVGLLVIWALYMAALIVMNFTT